MKFFVLSSLAIITIADAGKPQLTIQVSNGEFGGLDGFDPSLTWSGETSSGDIDLEYGVDLNAKPTTDISSLPKKIWGKASTTFGGWTASARADVTGTDFGSAGYEIDAVNDELSIKLTASSSGLHTVEATQGFDADGAKITVNPRYNLDTEEGDVIVNYDAGNTNVELTASTSAQSVKIEHKAGDTNFEVNASKDAQSVTISQQLDDDNRIAPTFTSDGDISIEWERNLGDDNSLTATVKPDNAIDLEWKDSDWTANINLPIDGTTITGANVGIKREVNF